MTFPVSDAGVRDFLTPVSPSELSRPEGGWDIGRWTGFSACRAAEIAAPGPPCSALAADGWAFRHYATQGRVGPLGCHLVRDIDICRTGYAFAQGRFIHDGSHTSTAALGWLRRANFPGNPLVDPPARRVVPDRPVLLAFGAGYPVYGHWLLDFLPRVAIARETMGEIFADLLIPLPDDTPDFVREMLRFFLDIPDSRILTFAAATDMLVCDRVCLPTFAHDGQYLFHSFFRDLYRRFVPATPPGAPRKICISRLDFEQRTRGVWRVFEAREAFERLAAAHGYAIVYPERLTIPEQIALFAGADRIVGEHGSGLHNTVFSPAGAVCGYFPLTNATQIRIGQLFGQPNVFIEHMDESFDERGVKFYTATECEMEALLSRLDGPAPG